MTTVEQPSLIEFVASRAEVVRRTLRSSRAKRGVDAGDLNPPVPSYDNLMAAVELLAAAAQDEMNAGDYARAGEINRLSLAMYGLGRAVES